MGVDQAYQQGTRAVLLAARELESAVAYGDGSEIRARGQDLLRAALSRESAGVVAGFRPEGAADRAAGTTTREDEVSLVLAELEVGEVLLAGSVVAAPDAGYTFLAPATEALADATERLRPPSASAVVGFDGEPAHPGDFYALLPKTVEGIVDRTTAVAQRVIGGLGAIPAAQLQPALSTALSAVPQGAPLAKAGMRAVERALRALGDLVPAEIRDPVKAWVRQWWDDHVDGILHTNVRRALGVAQVETAMSSAEVRPRPAEDLLSRAVTELDRIDSGHTGATKVIDRIVAVLSRLIGPLALLQTAAAPWVYAAGGFGLLLAFGAAVWIGRDYLDTGTLLDRVTGVRAVLRQVTA